jgi:hypothetical protein
VELVRVGLVVLEHQVRAVLVVLEEQEHLLQHQTIQQETQAQLQAEGAVALLPLKLDVNPILLKAEAAGVAEHI